MKPEYSIAAVVFSRPVALQIVRHPLVEECLGGLRDKRTPPTEFRRLARRISLLLIAEATRDLAIAEATVETPLEASRAGRLAVPVVAVPILRAGLGMLDAFLDLVPDARVGYLGLERNEETAVARRYYGKLPAELDGAAVFLLDPMLATGGSAVMAAEGLRGHNARGVRMVSIVAAPEGVAHLEAHAPEVGVYAAALDRCLNDRKYIVPGLGDFGDRLYGT
jgi:uracil phosphoribosyltransferase